MGQAIMWRIWAAPKTLDYETFARVNNQKHAGLVDLLSNQMARKVSCIAHCSGAPCNPESCTSVISSLVEGFEPEKHGSPL